MKTLVYLHGFLSSPESFKARATEKWLEQNRPDISYHCPQLSSYPSEAIETLQQLITDLNHQGVEVMLAGSSLGGYWATWLANEYNLRAVLINPAVRPSILLPEFLGVELKSYYSDDVYILSEQDVEDLKSAYVERLEKPENFWLMAQKGDTTCDYRLALEKYPLSKQTIEEGGDHSFQNYEQWLPEIIEFLEETSA